MPRPSLTKIILDLVEPDTHHRAVRSSDPISVIGLGTIVVDHQVVLSEFPPSDTKCDIESDQYQVGGPVPTALCLLVRLGARATFHGRWAEDHFGEIIEADLLQNNINFDPHPHSPDGRTGFAHVWLEKDTGCRTVAAFRGSHPIAPETVVPYHFTKHDALHLDGWSGPAAITAAKAMRAADKPVYMDLGSPKPDLERLLENVSCLNCPARLIEQLFETKDLKKGARKLLAMGPAEITITSGQRGASLFTENGNFSHPGFTVEAVDTNGAGDVFAGALVFASLNQLPPQEKLSFACAAGALKCQNLGNRDSLPFLEEIQELAGLTHA
ncbi:MAG: PfkB family carbohydrate kinase [Verrucomicrobiota bacterium]